jgi:transposase
VCESGPCVLVSYVHMVVNIFNHEGVRGPVEVVTSVERRRRWPEEEKGRIVAESYAPGAVVSDVARRHERPASL